MFKFRGTTSLCTVPFRYMSATSVAGAPYKGGMNAGRKFVRKDIKKTGDMMEYIDTLMKRRAESKTGVIDLPVNNFKSMVELIED